MVINKRRREDKNRYNNVSGNPKKTLQKMNEQGFEKEAAQMAEYFQLINDRASNILSGEQRGKYQIYTFFINILYYYKLLTRLNFSS